MVLYNIALILYAFHSVSVYGVLDKTTAVYYNPIGFHGKDCRMPRSLNRLSPKTVEFSVKARQGNENLQSWALSRWGRAEPPGGSNGGLFVDLPVHVPEQPPGSWA